MLLFPLDSSNFWNHISLAIYSSWNLYVWELSSSSSEERSSTRRAANEPTDRWHTWARTQTVLGSVWEIIGGIYSKSTSTNDFRWTQSLLLPIPPPRHHLFTQFFVTFPQRFTYRPTPHHISDDVMCGRALAASYSMSEFLSINKPEATLSTHVCKVQLFSDTWSGFK